MHTARAVTRPSSEPVSMRPIVDRQTPVKTLPSLAVGNKEYTETDYPIVTGHPCYDLFETNYCSYINRALSFL